MKKIALIPLLILALTTSLVLAPILPSYAAPQAQAFTKMSVAPDNNTYYSDSTPVGSTFTVDITVTNVSRLYAWQAKLLFNATVLNCTVATIPVHNVFEGYSTVPVSPVIDNVGGSVLYGTTMLGSGNVNGSGILCQFTFQIKLDPPVSGSLFSVLNFSMPYGSDTFLWDDLLNLIDADYENGFFEYIYHTTQMVPIFKVNPAQYIAPVDHVGETFDVNIDLINASASNMIVGAQFKLTYNTTLLEVLNVTEGPFFAQFNNTATPPYTFFVSWTEMDYVVCGIMLMPNGTGYWNGPFPDGTGTLATITFKEKYQPVIPEPSLNCSLALSETALVDQNVNEVLHDVESGYYEVEALTAPSLSIELASYTATHRGELFNVTVNIANVDAKWRLVGLQFKIDFGNMTLEGVDIAEGSFMASFPSQAPPDPATFFIKYIEYYNSHTYALVGILILPNATGHWNQPFPSGDGSLATITFMAIQGPPTSCALDLYEVTLVNPESEDIPYISAQNATYSMTVESLTHEIVWDSQSYFVTTVSTATVNEGYPIPPMTFLQKQRAIAFNWTAPEGFSGVCNVTIPAALLNASETDWLVLVGGVPVQALIISNGTHTFISFNHTFASSVTVYIFGTQAIPEYTANVALALILIAGLGTMVLAKKNKASKHRGKIAIKGNI
jgi:hypothetical protein